MIYIIFVLVYMIGGAGTFRHAVVNNASFRSWLNRRVDGPFPPAPKFHSYLFCYGLLWPLTIWYVVYHIWQEYTGRRA